MKRLANMETCAAHLRAGERVSDEDFDRGYPPEVRSISFRHWTPAGVAKRAARLLADVGASHVLDIGSGAGKFCIIGALSTSAHFTGIEQRANLVKVSALAALRFGADRARFVHGNITNFDCSRFDGFYLYNPFEEVAIEDPLPIDSTVHRSIELHNLYVASVKAILIRAPLGTAAVTYNGFGGRMPSQYRRVVTKQMNGAELVLWVRTGAGQSLAQPTSVVDANDPLDPAA